MGTFEDIYRFVLMFVFSGLSILFHFCCRYVTFVGRAKAWLEGWAWVGGGGWAWVGRVD